MLPLLCSHLCLHSIVRGRALEPFQCTYAVCTFVFNQELFRASLPKKTYSIDHDAVLPLARTWIHLYVLTFQGKRPLSHTLYLTTYTLAADLSKRDSAARHDLSVQFRYPLRHPSYFTAPSYSQD
ncbi:hypothetical protein K435DRAFT_20286 [Dendrothele bispora CBS 962.96]|uniref:Secreted protein n=1 Tax=Dendrothele bispora (strain CBS 962.96) TaxID=1314807 RepID=A0A4V4HJ19_DENBC|nr:hypothetical protein K435DRAFT_20286 [Dendrothele bispora CBS 962.96]